MLLLKKLDQTKKLFIILKALLGVEGAPKANPPVEGAENEFAPKLKAISS